jgi:hypothetical protein
MMRRHIAGSCAWPLALSALLLALSGTTPAAIARHPSAWRKKNQPASVLLQTSEQTQTSMLLSGLSTAQGTSSTKVAKGGGKSSSKGAKAAPASELCGKSGKGGRYCWPMKRYPILGMKMSPFFIGCCQPCPEKMANDLSFLQLPSHVHDKAMQRFQAFHQSFWSTLALELGDDSLRDIPRAYERSRGKGSSRSSSKRKRSAANAARAEVATQDNGHGRRKLLGLVPALYGTGAQLQGMLKCCNICPEQYYSPADYEDTTTFLSEEELRGHRIRGANSAMESVDREANLQENQKNQHYGSASTSEKVLSRRVDVSVATKKGGSESASKSGSNGGSCCKICPTDRFPYRGVSAFSIGAKAAFIEVMEKGHATHRTKQMAAGIIPALNVGQSGCCPVCPTLYSMHNGGTEPFGGPFGMGDANMKEALTQALRTQCSCYPKCTEEEKQLPVCDEEKLMAQTTLV